MFLTVAGNKIKYAAAPFSHIFHHHVGSASPHDTQHLFITRRSRMCVNVRPCDTSSHRRCFNAPSTGPCPVQACKFYSLGVRTPCFICRRADISEVRSTSTLFLGCMCWVRIACAHFFAAEVDVPLFCVVRRITLSSWSPLCRTKTGWWNLGMRT